MKNNKRKGFTLVELLVVIAIIAILASVTVLGYLGFTEKANKSIDEQLCAQYNTLLKSEEVEDDDISLAEFITLIEENGIHANKFQTSSKGYAFAYHKAGNQCVLLDKDTGAVLYPEEKEIESKELWAVLDPNFRMQAGVANYTLLQSATYTEPINGSGSYTFDLNDHMMKFNANPNRVINLTNGATVLPETHSNIKPDKTVSVIDNANAVMNTDETSLTKGVTSKMTDKGELTGKYIASSNVEGKKLAVSLPDANKAYVFKDCIFDNVVVSLQTYNVDYKSIEFDNCQFYNAEGYIFQASNVDNVYIHDCTISKTNRSFNIMLGKKSTVIENNIFDLDAILTANKGERKDNAIQFKFDAPQEIFNTWDETPVLKNSDLKVTIKNNEIKKAKAFITLHAGFGTKTTTTVQRDALINDLFTFDHFDISGNKLGNGVAKFTQDPGASEDIKEEAQLGYYKEICEKFESLIK